MKAGALRGISIAVAGFVLAGLLVTVPSQAGPGQLASAAKKKCKPKVPYGAGAKKKKCKKRKAIPIVLPGADPVAPVTPPVATTLERGRLTWSAAGKDIDFHAFDQAGRQTSFFDDEIPGGSHSGDAQTAGFEAFTDEQWLVPVPAGGNRNFTYGMCLHDPGPVNAVLSVILTNGTPFTQNVTLQDGIGQVAATPGGFIPAESEYC